MMHKVFGHKILCKNSQLLQIVRSKSRSAMTANNEVVVEHAGDDEWLSLRLRYVDEKAHIDRIFNWRRSTSEESSVSLIRIGENISRVVNKKNKKKKLSDFSLPVSLVDEFDMEVDTEKLGTCWDMCSGKRHHLKIGDSTYRFRVNPPSIKKLTLPKNIMAGFMLYPKQLELFNCEKTNIYYEWFKSQNNFELYSDLPKSMSSLKWVLAGTGPSVLTTNADIGKVFKLVVTPSKEDPAYRSEALLEVLVSPGPGLCPFERRQLFTTKPCDTSSIRVVTYNILADLYADSEYSRTVLFPTCPKYALSICYRKQLIIKELLGYNADIICLQEVDRKIFANDLHGTFESAGFESVFHKKSTDSCSEGLVTFHRKSKFREQTIFYYSLNEEVDHSPVFADLKAKLQKNPDALNNLIKRNTVLQISILEHIDEPSRYLVIANTHLYSEATSDHIKLLQFHVCQELLRQVVEKYKTEVPNADVSVIFSGDFNSCPENAVYRYATTKSIGLSDPDWRSKPTEEVEGVELSHDWNLSSAYGTPDYTTYCVGFQGCLDYIFFENDKLQVDQIIPLPSHEEVIEFKALPSVVMPSDHIALIADFTWKGTENTNARSEER